MNTRSLRDLLAEKGFRLIDLAQMVGVDKATVTRWNQHKLPAERIADVERLTGIGRAALRPDLFGPQAPFITQDGTAIGRGERIA